MPTPLPHGEISEMTTDQTADMGSEPRSHLVHHDPDHHTGEAMIAFAAEFMPALAAAAHDVGAQGRLRGLRIGVNLVLEPKTACLALALADLGAEVSVLGSSNSTKQPVVEALQRRGIAVFAEAGAGRTRRNELRRSFIETNVQLLADDGASIIRQIHREHPEALAALRGAAEETTSGVRPLRNMAEAGELKIPCVAVNDARTKLTFDNIYGTGQSVVMAVSDTTNMQLSGKAVTVVGYGRVGKGIAWAARSLGARVTVTEIDAVEALTAHHDGYEVAPIDDAVINADIVITASGIGYSLTGDHVAKMQDGTVIAVGGAGPPEFAPMTADGTPPIWGDEVRPHVRELIVPDGPTVFVIAETHCANTSAGEGNPIEVMDLSLALQLRALDYLASTSLEPGVHLLPRSIDDAVAASQLAAAGIRIDVPSAAQQEAARSW